jgi:CDP-glucose 4,6-dehydratase
MSVRPWQHVLDAVAGYLRLGDALLVDGAAVAEGWNFGPLPEPAVTVAEVVEMLIESWRSLGGDAKDPILETGAAVPERAFLTLISEKARARLGWAPLLDLPSTIGWTVEWYRSALSQADTARITSSQISQYLAIDAEGCLASTGPDLKSLRGSSPTSRTSRA